MSKQSRKLTRRLLFQKLFALWFNHINDNDFLTSFYFDDWNLSIDQNYYNRMQEIIFENEGIFIEIIKKYAPKFNVESMSILYMLPIFIACAEMFYFEEEIPALVSINEAIELSKSYWDEWIKRIVNWILNNILTDYDKLVIELKDKKVNSSFSIFMR